MIGAFSMPGLVSSVMASSYAVTSLLALPHAAEDRAAEMRAASTGTRRELSIRIGR